MRFSYNREDLDGLAALIEVCDLVVSPNVTVHLAGALAKDMGVTTPCSKLLVVSGAHG